MPAVRGGWTRRRCARRFTPPRETRSCGTTGTGSTTGRADYDYKRDGFCLPKVPPATVQLGNNCRAILLNRRLRPAAALDSVTLETLSQEVIVGLMGASLMNPR